MQENEQKLYDELLDKMLESFLQISGGDVNTALDLVCQQFGGTEVTERGTEFLLGRLEEIRKGATPELFQGQTSIVQGFTAHGTDLAGK